MSGIQPLDRFDFDEQPIADDEIDAERGVEVQSLEIDRDRALPLDLLSEAGELARQHSLVDAFKQSTPKLAVKAK